MSQTSSQPQQFRNSYNPTVITALAQRIQTNYPNFQTTAFTESILPQLSSLSLTQRAQLIEHSLTQYLPKHFPTAVNILLDALAPENLTTGYGGLNGFIIVPQTMFIATHGQSHFDLSMTALAEFTKRFSSESAIRYFILEQPNKTMNQMKDWASSDNLHIRRLASEGCRPRLPWAIQLKPFIKDPTPVLHILEILKTDPERYVQRSVANNLNDIAKDHPNRVVSVLNQWASIQHSGTQWLSRHAARTLLKQGHPGALRLLGYFPPKNISLNTFMISSPNIPQHGQLTFELTLTSHHSQAQSIMIDYVIHFMKANGQTRPKVFKWINRSIQPGETLTVSKTHSFKPITTRTYYPGSHAIHLVMNGMIFTDAIPFNYALILPS